LFGGLLVPLMVASLTDGLLPVRGYQLPRLGASSIILLVGSVAFTIHRYGYSMLAPGAFAPQILSTLREGVALLRPDGRINTANAGMGRLLGVAPGRLEGRQISGFIPDVAIESTHDISEFECEMTRADGAAVPVSLSTSLLRDKKGNSLGLVLVARDLREVASLRSRLITSGRLASVGQLAAGIAHEINNPLAFVRSNLGVLASILDNLGSKLPEPLDEATRRELLEGRELLEESVEGVDRVAAIVRDVKGFSHAGDGPQQVIAIVPMLDAVLRVAAPQLRAGCSIVRDYADVPPVRGAPQELKQVFLNLVINASQASDGSAGGQEIRLTTSAVGDRVVVEVYDQGCGIPAELLDRVFDPFFTTKAVGDGTGLGLSISYQIVRSHGGDLSVESAPGEGTCFRVELPAAELSAPERPDHST
jgi:two-component system cell cycle sensor histidine kinase/response regulator CckA